MNEVLADELLAAVSGHVQALVKRGVGPFRDPKHRLQERVRSCPTVWAECSKPRQGRCHKHRHQSLRILNTHPSPSRAGVRLDLRDLLLLRAHGAHHVFIMPSRSSHYFVLTSCFCCLAPIVGPPHCQCALGNGVSASGPRRVAATLGRRWPTLRLQAQAGD